MLQYFCVMFLIFWNEIVLKVMIFSLFLKLQVYVKNESKVLKILKCVQKDVRKALKIKNFNILSYVRNNMENGRFFSKKNAGII